MPPVSPDLSSDAKRYWKPDGQHGEIDAKLSAGCFRRRFDESPCSPTGTMRVSDNLVSILYQSECSKGAAVRIHSDPFALFTVSVIL